MKTRLAQFLFGLTAFAAIYLVAGGWSAFSRTDSDESAKEQVTAAQLPPAARATLDRETAGRGAAEIEKVTRDGNTAYRAYIKVKGESQVVTVGEDGTILERGEMGDDDD